MEATNNGTDAKETREWYALHTRARHEKAIAARLGEQATEVYLPLHRRRKKWRNGVHAEVDFPLLPCYLFAHVGAEERARLLATKGVLGFAEQPTLTEEEMARLRAAATMKAVPHAQPEGGERVRIVRGPLAGTEGFLERTDGECRVVLAYTPMRRAIAVAVNEQELEPARRAG
jgi:transcription antitermination factor NusG